MKTVYNFENLGFSVIMEVADFICNFKIFEITAIDEYDSDSDDDEFEAVLYYDKPNCNNPTDKIEEATVFMSGSVKWDGCSNWAVDNGGCMIHSCSRNNLLNIGIIMAECWDLAKKELNIS